MENEITLAYVQEMVRRKEGRLGEKQQILRLMDAVGRLAHAIDREEGMEEAFGDILYNTLALANTYGRSRRTPSHVAPAAAGAYRG